MKTLAEDDHSLTLLLVFSPAKAWLAYFIYNIVQNASVVRSINLILVRINTHICKLPRARDSPVAYIWIRLAISTSSFCKTGTNQETTRQTEPLGLCPRVHRVEPCLLIARSPGEIESRGVQISWNHDVVLSVSRVTGHPWNQELAHYIDHYQKSWHIDRPLAEPSYYLPGGGNSESKPLSIDPSTPEALTAININFFNERFMAVISGVLVRLPTLAQG